MTTINSLPSESLFRILELASERDPNPFKSNKATLKILCSSSLVAQSWKEPAQSLMWLDVELVASEGVSMNQLVEGITRSPVCGKYRTARLVLWASRTFRTVERVLTALKGLEWLELKTFPQSPMSDVPDLSFASLQGLKTLVVDAPFNDLPLSSVRPSFHLQSLTLRSIQYCPALIEALFASSSSTLQSLTMEDEDPITLPPFSIISNSLVNLSVHAPFPELAPIICSFTALSHLTLYFHHNANFQEFDNFIVGLETSSIKLITIDIVYDYQFESRSFRGNLAELLRRTGGELVKEVIINRMHYSGIVAGSEKVLELCEEKAIRVRYVGMPLNVWPTLKFGQFGPSSFQ